MKNTLLETKLLRKNKNLWSRYLQIKEVAQLILTWENPYALYRRADIDSPRYFNDHGINHSQRVIEYLDLLTQNLKLEDKEIFLILVGAVLHDIGMFIGIDKGESWDITRNLHHERSEKWMEKLSQEGKLPIEKAEIHYIKNLCFGHRSKVDITTFPNKSFLHGKKVQIQLLVSLLRIADACDVDERRSPRVIFEIYQKLFPSTESHFWEKNLLVASVRPNFSTATIEVSFNFSKVPAIKNLQRQIAYQIRTTLQQELQSVKEVFESYQVDLFYVTIKDFETQRDINTEELLAHSVIDVCKRLVSLSEAKDPFRAGHSQRVSAVAKGFALVLGLNSELIEAIEIGGLLHDIGMVSIPDQILKKISPLTKEEWETIERHPEIGFNLLKSMGCFSKEVLDIVCFHHERLDEKGYPKGLKGEEIPLVARIVEIADLYDAMTCERPYRQALSKEYALEELLREAKKKKRFDPGIVTAFRHYILKTET